MRSCSLSVLVEQAAEEVAPVDSGWPSLADEGQAGRWTRRFQPERSVWTMSVVVLDVDPEDLLQVAVGFAVTPARWTLGGSCSIKNNTYSRRSHTVSAVKKSQARTPVACWRRNARQVIAVRRGAGSNPCRRSVVRIAVAETCMPSRRSSPLMRW